MFDVQDFVYRMFPDVREYGGTDLRVNCPFCSERYGKEDRKHKLYIGIDRRVCHCFRCEYSRSWVGLVMDVLEVPYADAVAELYTTPRAKSYDDVKEHVENGVGYVHPLQMLLGSPLKFIPLAMGKSVLVKKARRYMTNRGFGDEYWKRYSLCVSEQLGFRVVIPIEGTFWQARALFPFMVPRYLSPKQESRSVLFNASALDHYDEVVICEGAFSAMRIGNNAVALVGKTSTKDTSLKEKIDRLVKSDVETFVVALDADAYMYALPLAKRLRRAGKDVEVWKYDEGDPADDGPFTVVVPDFLEEVKHALSTT